jgi:release factor glutamine methyltransferase
MAPAVGPLLDELATLVGGDLAPPDRSLARDVIAAVLDRPRFWPTANRGTLVTDADAAAMRTAARALRDGAPFAYAVGRASFRHLTLAVDRRVLIPRPETELLVDLALQATGGRGRVADVCTGSGAVALALAAEGKFERVLGTDISADAIAVARANVGAIPADRRGAVEFREGDLLTPLAGERLTAIVANPPYIATHERDNLPALVRDWEPALALFGGDDGLQVIARIVAGAGNLLEPGGLLMLEIDARRGPESAALAATHDGWTDVQLRTDLTGRNRFLLARRATS